jgi:hypothetical protein
MEFIANLWLPIVVSAVLVWVASFLMHMVLPHHKKDYAGLPDEDKFYTGLEGVKPGQYMFPWCTSMAVMKNPEFLERQKRVPNGTMTIWDGPVNMGKNLMLTLLFYLVVGIFIAYLASHSIAPGTPYLKVFQVAGAAAFMAHGLGWVPHTIWFGWKGFWAYMFDSIVFALVTAGTFGWLWPR